MVEDIDLVVLEDDSQCICAGHGVPDLLSAFELLVDSLERFLFDGN